MSQKQAQRFSQNRLQISFVFDFDDNPNVWLIYWRKNGYSNVSTRIDFTRNVALD
jgi:hypothetical protein